MALKKVGIYPFGSDDEREAITNILKAEQKTAIVRVFSSNEGLSSEDVHTPDHGQVEEQYYLLPHGITFDACKNFLRQGLPKDSPEPEVLRTRDRVFQAYLELRGF